MTPSRIQSPSFLAVWVFVGLCIGAIEATAAEPAGAPRVMVGVAKVDITPELPIRLSGYRGGARDQEATQIEGRLYARALAISGDAQPPVVLITAEIVGVSAEISDAVAEALRLSHGIPRERVAVSVTHTHTGPSIRGVLPYLFAQDLPTEHSARIDRYTAELQDKLIRVATEALANRQPATLSWSQGHVGFATQRRVVREGRWADFGTVPQGTADYALPVMRAVDGEGRVRAVLTSYACHCTTLAGRDNFVHPDWAGDAAAKIEDANGGAVALVAIGCGADANPSPRKGLADVARHGSDLAAEVARVLAGPLRPIGAVSEARYRVVDLPFDHVVTREELSARQQSEIPYVRYAAAQLLRQLEAGPLPTGLPLPVQTWNFGGELSMVFLGGEVVADYSLRLRRELDATRLWVNAYSNSVPAYIASKRVIDEGGYEVDGSMNYYGWPTHLARESEEILVGSVHELVPDDFARADKADAKR